MRFTIIVAVVEVPLTLLSFVLDVAGLLPSSGPPPTGRAFAVSSLVLILTTPLDFLMFGALIHSIAQQHIRRSISVASAYSFAFRRLGSMLGAGILLGIVLVLLTITIIGIPFAIYFFVRWFFSFQTVVLERRGPRAALSRIAELVKGNWWRVFGISMALTIGPVTIAILMGLVLYPVPFVGSLVTAILITPFVTIAGTLLYFDLRVRKQAEGGYNLGTLKSELQL